MFVCLVNYWEENWGPKSIDLKNLILIYFAPHKDGTWQCWEVFIFLVSCQLINNIVIFSSSVFASHSSHCISLFYIPNLSRIIDLYTTTTFFMGNLCVRHSVSGECLSFWATSILAHRSQSWIYFPNSHSTTLRVCAMAQVLNNQIIITNHYSPFSCCSQTTRVYFECQQTTLYLTSTLSVSRAFYLEQCNHISTLELISAFTNRRS